MSRIGLGVAILAFPLLALAGCDDEPSTYAEEFREGLEDLPGVQDVMVEDEVVDDGVSQWHVVVDTDDDVTSDELTEIFTELGTWTQDEEGNEESASPLVYLDAGTTEWTNYALLLTGTTSGAAYLPGESDPPDVLADRLLTARERFVSGDDEKVWITDRDETIVDLEGDDPGDLLDIANDWNGDESFASSKAVQLENEAASIHTDLGFDDEFLGTVEATFDTLAKLPSGVESHHLHVSEGDDPGHSSRDEPGLQIEQDVDIDGDPAPEELTTEEYGDELWPLIHAQLDVLRDYPGTDYYGAQNVGVREDGSADPDYFCAAGLGLTPETDEHGRTWNVEADEYLNS